jgi:hypothetical protein
MHTDRLRHTTNKNFHQFTGDSRNALTHEAGSVSVRKRVRESCDETDRPTNRHTHTHTHADIHADRQEEKINFHPFTGDSCNALTHEAGSVGVRKRVCESCDVLAIVRGVGPLAAGAIVVAGVGLTVLNVHLTHVARVGRIAVAGVHLEKKNRMTLFLS